MSPGAQTVYRERDTIILIVCALAIVGTMATGADSD